MASAVRWVRKNRDMVLSPVSGKSLKSSSSVVHTLDVIGRLDGINPHELTLRITGEDMYEKNQAKVDAAVIKNEFDAGQWVYENRDSLAKIQGLEINYKTMGYMLLAAGKIKDKQAEHLPSLAGFYGLYKANQKAIDSAGIDGNLGKAIAWVRENRIKMVNPSGKNTPDSKELAIALMYGGQVALTQIKRLTICMCLALFKVGL